MRAVRAGGGRVAASRLFIVAVLVIIGLTAACPYPARAAESAALPTDGAPAEHALQALRRAWIGEIDELTAITRALAVADDTYEFVARANLPYIYDHYDRQRLAAHRIDTVLIVDRSGKPLFWRRTGNRRNRGFPDAEAFLAQLPPLTSTAPSGVPSLAGAIQLTDGPTLIVALPIYPASGAGESRGWLITARAFDAAERHRYEDLAHVAVDVLDPSKSTLPVGADLALKTPLQPVTHVETAHIRGFMAVPDVEGRPLRIFSVLLPKPAATVVPTTATSPVRYGFWLALWVIIVAIAGLAGITQLVLRRRAGASASATRSVPPQPSSIQGTTGRRSAEFLAREAIPETPVGHVAASAPPPPAAPALTSRPTAEGTARASTPDAVGVGAARNVPPLIATVPDTTTETTSDETDDVTTPESTSTEGAGDVPPLIATVPESATVTMADILATLKAPGAAIAAAPDAVRPFATSDPEPTSLPVAAALAPVSTVAASSADALDIVPPLFAAMSTPTHPPTPEAGAQVATTEAADDGSYPAVPPLLAAITSQPGDAKADTLVPAASPSATIEGQSAQRQDQAPEVEVTFDFHAGDPAAARSQVPTVPAAPRDLESFLTGTPTVFRFEPQFNLRTGRVAGVESLLCITQSGEARPAPELATDVEAAGLGLDLAERWLREACAERRSWRRQAGQDFPVSVPVSSGMLEHPDFLPLVRRVLTDNELPSSFLELEIPEHVLAGSEAVRRALGKIHAAGVLICIREFDGSQSNIRSLTFVPLAKLLIDPKLIREAATGTPAAALFDGIIGAARALGILVCASGIDSPALAATAERHGCVLAQGTTFGPRVDSEQFLSLVRGAGVDTATLPPLDLDLIGADGPLSEAQPDPATTR